MQRRIAYDRNINDKNKFLYQHLHFYFPEMIQYIVTKHNDEKELDLEEKLTSLDYPIGEKILEWCFLIKEKNLKRNLKINDILIFIHNNV